MTRAERITEVCQIPIEDEDTWSRGAHFRRGYEYPEGGWSTYSDGRHEFWVVSKGKRSPLYYSVERLSRVVQYLIDGTDPREGQR